MGISIPGLASNLDTTAMITAIMNFEKIPYKNLETKKAAVTSSQTTITNINLKLKTLRDAAIALSDIDSFKSNGAVISDATKLSATVGDNAIPGNYSVKVTQLAKQQVSATGSISLKDNMGGDVKLSAADLTSTITVGGTTFDLNELGLTADNTMEEALTKISDKINTISGVQASVIQTSEGNRTLVVTAKESGVSIGISGTGQFSFGVKPKVEAQLAKIEVNGIEVTSSSNSVKDAIPGVTLQLLAENTTINVEIKQDTDKITAKVEAFVEAYNVAVSLIRENTKKVINEKDAEGNYKNFKTNLQGDSLLRDLQNELSDIVNSVTGPSGQYRLLDQLGIEIDKGITSGALMTGKISFDKDLFKKMLSANPTAVEEMFKGANGLGSITKDRLNNWTKTNGLMDSKMEGYKSEITFISSQMESMNQRLTLKEEALKRQYTQLEVSMTKLKSQQDWMKSQLSALTASNKS